MLASGSREVACAGLAIKAVLMQMVWDHDGPVTVRDLFSELSGEREIAYTTVMSTMDELAP